MLKVLIVAATYPYPEHRDGLAKINANLLRENPYYQADMLCIQDVDRPELERTTFFKLPAHAPRSRVHELMAYASGGQPMGVSRLVPYLPAFRDFIVKNHQRYDRIHLSSPYLAGIVDGLPLDVLDKIILFPIDCVSLFWSRRLQAEKSWLKKMAYRLELRRNARHEARYYPRFPAVAFVSEVDAQYARQIAPGAHCLSIPNGVDIDYFSSQGKEEEAKIVFTGDMAYAPNRAAAYFLLDEVMPRLPDELKVHLYLVGQRPCERLANLNLPNVTVTGFVDDLRPYLAAATVYLSPLSFGSGIKNKVLEAMAMGKTVIGTDISFDGIACTDRRHCVFVEPSADAMAAEIIAVLKNPSMRAEIGAQARSLIEEKYSWHSIRRAYGELYARRFSH